MIAPSVNTTLPTEAAAYLKMAMMDMNLTNILPEDLLNSVSSFLTDQIMGPETQLPGSLLAAKGMKPKHPVFLIPGITSTVK